MSVTRKEIQEKINKLKELYPKKDREFIKAQVNTWLGSKELANVAFTQEQMQQRLLDDLNSYQGMGEGGENS